MNHPHYPEMNLVGFRSITTPDYELIARQTDQLDLTPTEGIVSALATLDLPQSEKMKNDIASSVMIGNLITTAEAGMFGSSSAHMSTNEFEGKDDRFNGLKVFAHYLGREPKDTLKIGSIVCKVWGIQRKQLNSSQPLTDRVRFVTNLEDLFEN